jgi:hypothetical protein
LTKARDGRRAEPPPTDIVEGMDRIEADFPGSLGKAAVLNALIRTPGRFGLIRKARLEYSPVKCRLSTATR